MDLDWYTATMGDGDDHDDGDFSPYDFEDEDHWEVEDDDSDDSLHSDELDDDEDYIFETINFFKPVLPPCTLRYYLWLDGHLEHKAPWRFIRDRVVPILVGLAIVAAAFINYDSNFRLVLLFISAYLYKPWNQQREIAPSWWIWLSKKCVSLPPNGTYVYTDGPDSISSVTQRTFGQYRPTHSRNLQENTSSDGNL